MRFKMLAVLTLLIASQALAHDPYERPLVPIDAAMGATSAVSVATDNNLTAAAWVDSSDNHVYVSLSDGRGRQWGAPMQVDKDGGAAPKVIREHSCQVVFDDQSGSNLDWIFVVWEDSRNDDINTPLVETDLYLATSSNKGGKWTEVAISKKYLFGTGAVVEWVFEAFDTGHGNHIWILLTVDPDGSSNDELYFVTSHDSGMSFLPPLEVSREAAGAHNISAIGMAVDGTMDTHMVFVDDRNGQHTVWAQHTQDGGFTWLASDMDLGAISDVDPGPGQAVIQKSGLAVATAWQEDLGGGRHALYMNVSPDLGLSWSGAMQVGGYVPGVDDTDNPSIGFDSTTATPAVYLAWQDDRNGVDDVFVGGTYDMGVSFVEERELSASLGGSRPMLIERHRDEDEMQCAFLRDVSGSDQAFIAERVYGASFWHPAYNLSWSHGATETTAFDVAWDPIYKNAITCLVDDSSGTSQAYAGGMRMPFIEAEGFDGGGTNVVWFSGDRLTQAASAGSTTAIFGVFLSYSDQPGLPLGDGRFMDLRVDSLLNLSLRFHTLLFSAPLGTGTAISTPLFKWKVPAGFSFYASGLVYDVDGGGNLILREVTDSVPVIVP